MRLFKKRSCAANAVGAHGHLWSILILGHFKLGYTKSRWTCVDRFIIEMSNKSGYWTWS